MSTFNARQGTLGLVIGLASHAITFLSGFVAGQLIEPSQGGGFEDLAAVLLTLFAVEAMLGVAAVVTAIVLARRGKRDLGFGVLAGWIVGVIAIFVLLRA